MRCGCFCHMPGCRVVMPDGEPCCADRDDVVSPPRAAPPPANVKVTPLSPTVPRGRKHARSD